MRILVVEDDYASRVKLKVLLSTYGDVDSASDGELALQMFDKASREGVHYDLITMDIGLPDMRGQEVVLQIRALERDRKAHLSGSEAKILMVTGMTDYKNVSASFQEGCEGYIVKPVNPESTQEALAKLDLAIGCA